jgi:hypothetical protein
MNKWQQSSHQDTEKKKKKKGHADHATYFSCETQRSIAFHLWHTRTDLHTWTLFLSRNSCFGILTICFIHDYIKKEVKAASSFCIMNCNFYSRHHFFTPRIRGCVFSLLAVSCGSRIQRFTNVHLELQETDVYSAVSKSFMMKPVFYPSIYNIQENLDRIYFGPHRWQIEISLSPRATPPTEVQLADMNLDCCTSVYVLFFLPHLLRRFIGDVTDRGRSYQDRLSVQPL